MVYRKIMVTRTIKVMLVPSEVNEDLITYKSHIKVLSIELNT